MARIFIFFHLLGMALWLGGMLTLGVWTARARRSGDAHVVSFAYGTAGRLYKGVVSVGAWLSILSGGALMFVAGRPWFRPFPDHWLFQMQVLGIAAFLVTVAYLVPNSSALARLAESGGSESPEAQRSAEFGKRVKRSAIFGSVVGVVLIYLILAGALRF